MPAVNSRVEHWQARLPDIRTHVNAAPTGPWAPRRTWRRRQLCGHPRRQGDARVLPQQPKVDGSLSGQEGVGVAHHALLAGRCQLWVDGRWMGWEGEGARGGHGRAAAGGSWRHFSAGPRPAATRAVAAQATAAQPPAQWQACKGAGSCSGSDWFQPGQAPAGSSHQHPPTQRPQNPQHSTRSTHRHTPLQRETG